MAITSQALVLSCLLLCTATAQVSCSTCTVSTTTYVCHAVQQITWPITVPQTITTVTINGTSITEVPANAFKNGVSVTTLNIRHNNLLVDIYDGSFAGPAWSTIELTNNNINRIRKGTFANLLNLQNLRIINEGITSITSDTFGPTLPSLQSLVLSGNRISSIASGAFSNLPSLTFLYIIRANLTAVQPGMFSNLNSLEVLQLINAGIRSIQEGSFDGLASLKQLSLADNRITSFPAHLFVQAINLISLDVSGNPIILDVHSTCALAQVATSTTQLRTDAPVSTYVNRVVSQCGTASLQCYSPTVAHTDYFCQCPTGQAFNGQQCQSASNCNPQNPASACYNYPQCTADNGGVNYHCTCALSLVLAGPRCTAPATTPAPTVAATTPPPPPPPPQLPQLPGILPTRSPTKITSGPDVSDTAMSEPPEDRCGKITTSPDAGDTQSDGGSRCTQQLHVLDKER